MTATSGKQLGVGLRHARLFALTAAGYPSAVDENAYEGLELRGPKAFDLTLPENRRISHTGEDRVLQVDVLPSLDGATAQLRAAHNDFDVIALLSGTNQVTVGEGKLVGHATSKQGSEPQLGLWLYQQALDPDTGVRVWHSYIIPKALIHLRPGGLNENAQEHTYDVQPQIVSKHLWGTAFASGVEGFTSAQILEMTHEYKPHVAAFVGDGTVVAFTFSATKQAVNTDKIAVFVDGAATTSGITKATTGVTFDTAPADGAVIVVVYETA